MTFKVTKAYNDDTQGFDETVAYRILHCTNVDGNNNKYFVIELQKNPTTGQFRIFTQYGRLAHANTYDLRGPSDDLEAVRKEFDGIVRKKLRGKKIKAEDGTVREERYVEIDTPSPTVGSANIRKAKPSGGSRNFRDVFAEDDQFAVPVRTLLSQLLEENIHQITGLSAVTVSDAGLETPLGPVTVEHLAKARAMLEALRQIGPIDVRDPQVRRLNTDYFSLVPHRFGSRITDRDMISSDATLLQEFDLLDQMETAVQMSDASQDNAAAGTRHDYGLRMELLTDQGACDEIVQRVDSTRRHTQLNAWKVRRIFTLENKDRSRYRPLPGPEYDLFHGSKNANVLSILLNGFMIPPVSAPHVTGRMFSDGVYGASAVTKSLNYSTGFWDGRGNQYDNSFVFIARFSMGNVYETYTSMPQGLPRGTSYNSIHAKAGKSLANDEYIVPNVNQVTITHLIEFGRG